MERLLKDAEKLTGMKYDISSFADVTQAIHAIQTELGITGTTALEASSTIEGSLNSMKSAWQNLMVGMSNPKADFSKLMQNLIDTVTTFGQNLIPVIEQAFVGVVQLIDGLFPVVAEKIPELISQLLPKLVEAGVNIVQSLMNGIQENLPLLINSALQIITTLSETILQMLPQILEIGMELIIKLMEGIAEKGPELVPQIIDIIIKMLEIFNKNFDKFMLAGIQLILGLIEGLIKSIPTILQNLPTILMAIINFFTAQKLVSAGLTLLKGLGTGLINGIPNLLRNIPKIISSIVNAFKTQGANAFKSIGTNIVQGLWNGIAGMGNWLYSQVKNFASGIIKAMTSALGIKSPSTKFRDLVGKFIPQGVAVGIELDTDKALKAIDNMDKSLIDEMSKSVLLNKNGISVSGVNGTVNQILSANARENININNKLELDGEVVYENQKTVTSKKNLQYSFA